MKNKSVLIFGTSHLAFRLHKKLKAQHDAVIYCSMNQLNEVSDEDSFAENIATYFSKILVDDIKMIFVLDDQDEHNLQICISILALQNKIPMYASLFNENLIPHLQQISSHLTILNRAKIAAPIFVAAIEKKLERKEMPTSNVHFQNEQGNKKNSLIFKLVISLLGVLFLAISYFHVVEKMSIIDSIYFVVTTATSTGYGDINLLKSPYYSKIAGIILMLSSTIFIWMIFSLTIDSFLKQRMQIALGRKKYSLKGHVILCGLGKVGYFIIEELLQKNEKVIIVEINENSKHIEHFKSLGAEVYIGDAKSFKVMNDVNVREAKALLTVIDDDATNLEIALNARSINQHLRIILRIFDEEMTKHIKGLLNIELSFSASTIALNKMDEILKSK
jgi:siroheme synthase (precorrin-2 oxidase/ferrochelatase)